MQSRSHLRYAACLLLLTGVSAVEYPPTTKLTAVALPSPIPARPGYLAPYQDVNHGTRVTRISDPAAMGYDLSAATRISHKYAKNQAWNADGTLLMLNWNTVAQILDGNSYAAVRQLQLPGQAMWSNLDPLVAFGRSESIKVVSTNMVTGVRSPLATLSQYTAISLGEGEGNLSIDDAWLALIGTRSGGGNDLAVFSMTAKAITATLDAGTTPINNCSMSQSGNYVVVQWLVPGTARFQGIEVFDRNLNFLRNVASTRGGHFDLGYDAAGNEVIVVTAADSSALVMRRLDTGAETTLLSSALIGYNLHISCRNTQRPGWAYISEFLGSTDITKPYTQDVFAVRLDPSATGNADVQRFAQEFHSGTTAYEREAHAVPSRDGSRVLFSSDWRDGAGTVLCYLAEAWPTAGNTAPTISNVANQTTAEDTAKGGIAITVGDVETAAAALALTVTSSNPTLVPIANLGLGGSGANRTLTATPAANQNGTATITLTVSDGSLSAIDTFVLTVTAVNDAPTISAVANQITTTGVATAALVFTVGDVETAAASLTVSGSSSNTALLPNASIVFSGSGANRTVTLTPAAAQTGTATVTLTVHDGTVATTTTFTLTVSAAPVTPTPVIGSSSGLATSTPSLSGTSTANATIRIYDGGVLLATFTASGTAWTWTASPALAAAGLHLITVTAHSAGAGESAPSGATSVTVPASGGTTTSSANGGGGGGGCGAGGLIGLLISILGLRRLHGAVR